MNIRNHAYKSISHLLYNCQLTNNRRYCALSCKTAEKNIVPQSYLVPPFFTKKLRGSSLTFTVSNLLGMTSSLSVKIFLLLDTLLMRSTP